MDGEAQEGQDTQTEEGGSETEGSDDDAQGKAEEPVKTTDTASAKTGQYIGFSGKDILTAADDREEAVLALAEKLQARNADVLVLFPGEDAPEDEAEDLKAKLEKACPMTEVILIPGGQPVYDYILVLC